MRIGYDGWIYVSGAELNEALRVQYRYDSVWPFAAEYFSSDLREWRADPCVKLGGRMPACTYYELRIDDTRKNRAFLGWPRPAELECPRTKTLVRHFRDGSAVVVARSADSVDLEPVALPSGYDFIGRVPPGAVDTASTTRSSALAMGFTDITLTVLSDASALVCGRMPSRMSDPVPTTSEEDAADLRDAKHLQRRAREIEAKEARERAELQRPGGDVTYTFNTTATMADSAAAVRDLTRLLAELDKLKQPAFPVQAPPRPFPVAWPTPREASWKLPLKPFPVELEEAPAEQRLGELRKLEARNGPGALKLLDLALEELRFRLVRSRARLTVAEWAVKLQAIGRIIEAPASASIDDASLVAFLGLLAARPSDGAPAPDDRNKLPSAARGPEWMRGGYRSSPPLDVGLDDPTGEDL